MSVVDTKVDRVVDSSFWVEKAELVKETSKLLKLEDLELVKLGSSVVDTQDVVFSKELKDSVDTRFKYFLLVYL